MRISSVQSNVRNNVRNNVQNNIVLRKDNFDKNQKASQPSFGVLISIEPVVIDEFSKSFGKLKQHCNFNFGLESKGIDRLQLEVDKYNSKASFFMDKIFKVEELTAIFEYLNHPKLKISNAEELVIPDANWANSSLQSVNFFARGILDESINIPEVRLFSADAEANFGVPDYDIYFIKELLSKYPPNFEKAYNLSIESLKVQKGRLRNNNNNNFIMGG